MRTNNLENCINEYKGFGPWKKRLEIDREEILKIFNFSVITEGALPELDMAIKWCVDNLGVCKRFTNIDEMSPNDTCVYLWYEKTGYDYGFTEFFFKTEENLNQFKSKISDFYSIGSDGNKWKTDGIDNEAKII